MKKFLLYARRSEIRGVDIDNPYLNVIMALTVPDIDDVTAVDYDAIDERIYWADVKTRTIKRAFINGTKLETVISGGMLQSILPVTFFTQFISLLIFLLLLIKLMCLCKENLLSYILFYLIVVILFAVIQLVLLA